VGDGVAVGVGVGVALGVVDGVVVGVVVGVALGVVDGVVVGVGVGSGVGVVDGVVVGVGVVPVMVTNALLNVVAAVMSSPMRSKTPSVRPVASDRISNVPVGELPLWNVTVPSWAVAPAGKPRPMKGGIATELKFSIRDPVSVVVPYANGREEPPSVFAYPITESAGIAPL
jgi:hypothetical protein